MGRSLSPLLRQELANLDKDADSRRSAMKALKSYAKDLDSKAIPHFLAEVSDTNGPGASSGECTISLYEVLARVHGRNIVPQIGNIMSTIMRTLSASGGSFALHQACSKVVPAIARYGIDPLTSDDEKARIICSLCKPLSDALMSLKESAAPSGAALCLKALVESSNWRFASDEMVNEVCLKVAGALEEKMTQSNAHIGLVMALVKHNGLIAEAYSRSLVRSGLQILVAGVADSNSQKRLMAIQMINFLMKCVDVRSMSSELFRIIDAMEKCQANDKMPFVRGAAFEALQTAKALTGQKGSRHEVGLSPMSSSSFLRKNERRHAKIGEFRENDTSEFCSPESQTVDSCIKYDAFTDSPVSICQPLHNFDSARRTNRRLWNNDGSGVNVSLKDVFFLKACSEDNIFADNEQSRFVQHNEVNQENSEKFSGFIPGIGSNTVAGGTSFDDQVMKTHLTVGDLKKIYASPHTLQSSSKTNSEHIKIERQDTATLPNQPCQHIKSDSKISLDRNNHPQNFNFKHEERKKLERIDMLEKMNCCAKDVELANDGAESVSSTDEVLESNISQIHGLDTGDRNLAVMSKTKFSYCTAVMGFILAFIFVILAVIMSSLREDTEEFLFEAVPT